MAGTGNKLAGRLWGGASSSSESSSSDSEDEAPQVQAADQTKKGRVVWAEASSSEDEVVTKRKVVSHTDKRYEQMKEAIKQMKNHQKVNDFAQLITDYEQTFKMLDKIKTLVEQDGGPPGFFIKAVASLELYCEKLHAEHLENKANKGQRLPENKQKAFNTLRAKVRKGNKVYQDLIEKCKEDPEQFEEAEGDGGSDSNSDKDSEEGKSSSSNSSDSGSDSSSSDSSSDSDSSGSDSSSSDSDSDSDDSESWKAATDSSDDEQDEEAAREKKMLRWLITPEQEAKRATKAETAKDTTKGKETKGKKERKTDKTPKGGKEVAHKDATSKEKEEYTPEQLMQKVTEIAQMRGRRGYVRKEYMEKLQALEEHAIKQGPRAQLHILTSMVSADFDNTGRAFEAMKIGVWNEAREKVLLMLPLITQSAQLEKEEMEDSKEKAALDEDDPRSHARLETLFVTFVEKLDDELFKALQLTPDLYGAEYQEILENSSKFLILLKRVHKFFETEKRLQPLGLISLRLMEQLYFKPDMLNKAVFDAIRNEVPEDQKEDWVWPEDSKAYMMKLCCYVFPNGKPLRPRNVESSNDPDAEPEGNIQARLHRRASLCQAYHLALHDYFRQARDLLHLGNLHEQALDSDVHTQILYNRVIAQMGVCAFRLGNLQEAHAFLADVCQHNKARELLAQGLSYAKNMDRTPEQERAEKMRQLPYHLHINTDVLESAHYICAMLLEVPNMAMQSMHPTNQRVISRVLKKTLEHYDKQYFIGPPENTREAIYSASKALQRGEWQECFGALENLKFWDHIDPGNPEAGGKIMAMIKEKIQIEALRTYLFAYSSIYDAFHLDQLVSMFGLPEKTVHSVVSKLMLREEITAFWDESSKYVLLQHIDPTPLQRLAQTLADKGAQAVENNEKLFDARSGGYGFALRDQRQQQAGAATGAGGGKGRFGKGSQNQGFDSKGKGKGRTAASAAVKRPAGNRGWENARAGALRGNVQRGWATNTPARA